MPTTRSGREAASSRRGATAATAPSHADPTDTTQASNQNEDVQEMELLTDKQSSRKRQAVKQTQTNRRGRSLEKDNGDEYSVHSSTTAASSTSSHSETCPRKKHRSSSNVDHDAEASLTTNNNEALASQQEQQPQRRRSNTTSAATIASEATNTSIKTGPVVASSKSKVASVTPGTNAATPTANSASDLSIAIDAPTTTATTQRPNNRLVTLPEGVVPIFLLDGCYTQGANAVATTLASHVASIRRGGTHPSRATATSSIAQSLGFATPTPTHSSSLRENDDPMHDDDDDNNGGSAAGTKIANRQLLAAMLQQQLRQQTLQRRRRRCSLAHAHFTMYGADYWKQLVARERTEKASQVSIRDSRRTSGSGDDESSSTSTAVGSTSPALSSTWEDDTTASHRTETERDGDCEVASRGSNHSDRVCLDGHQPQATSRNAAPSSSSSLLRDEMLMTSDNEDGGEDHDGESSVDDEVSGGGNNGSARLPHQPLLTVKMRRVLVLWMSEVAQEYKLSEAAYHLAVTLLDAVLMRGPAMRPSQIESLLATAAASAAAAGASDDDESATVRNKWIIKPRDFQALGCACMWIASKLEDKTPPLAEHLVYISNYCFTADKLSYMESRICKELDFRLHRVTPFHFVALYLRASRGVPVVETSASHRRPLTYQDDVDFGEDDDNDDGKPNVLLSMTLYLIEIGRSSNILSDKPPSLLAAAAVYLARATLGIQNKETLAVGGSSGGIIPQHSVAPPTSLLAQSAAATTTGKYWSRTLAYYTGYDVCEMVPTIRHLHALHKAAESRPNEAPSPAFTKYQTSAHYRVSLKTVRRVEDLGLVRFRTKRD